MKLRVFHAADGDCLLLSTDDEQHRMLIDGGRKGSFEANVRGPLAQLGQAGNALDVVCVSHIDNDHISGILQLVEDEVEWRAFEFRHAIDPSAKPPKVSRPPPVTQIWHNALFQLVGDDQAPQVEAALATSASLLLGAADEEVHDLGLRCENLATGEKAAMELSRRISAEQLDIPVNDPANGGLMKRGGPGDVAQLASLQLFVLGPSDDDLERLREDWDKWIKAHDEAIAELHARMLSDEEMLTTFDAVRVANPLLATALGDGLAGVTPPNLASLMLLVEEDGESVLLTGDGVSSEILEGLEHHGKLDANGRIHVTVLKVQHHGAEANVTTDFVKRVTADHYVFCGNGAHHNPELKVVERFAQARLQGIDGSGPLGPNTDFKFWFTSSSATPDLTDDRVEHMKAVESAVQTLAQGSGSRMAFGFIDEGHFDVL
jgi:hypothetical protein